ncbi:Fe-S cluster assembly sulfur transfer protein SufU [Lactobacillus helveticus]|jgi:nitrogen fixation protein NifU and related proteins|uniref:Fe-S cluster assembly sulfur transfer protein SufU n=1 Tax=Lactobacillus helveticus TaxID=1587 RepID=UPI001561CBC3|nr:SUF system NifU family Fe-S cluster assembly protein [Lactobacillus helveticus]NRN74524.1 Zinc-dependent sulfurtransferase SufU [Lactobacillus helveticus]NRN76451.1 Zinc-dependent sulfurtransferase SufU [Lactobacillus helveticus]NRN80592.1 Zinc-dependent sulfurtransferase SufU [Lactobacillus helveticus]NRN87399.1 Zinc-dependent sulfurtransferase SufU [Lactobacillus helveticus]NRN97465.1 Zinc-dependent sulfurtransferase SufU [Lactobacillus helveticus]
MSLDRLKSLYREVILENANNPQNHGSLADADYQTTVYNSSCGDKLNLFLNLNDQNEISAIKFNGEGCTISQASASLMTQVVKGKNKDEAIEIAKIFSKMAMGKDCSKDEIAKLGDAQIMTNIMMFPARIKCATLAWWALEQILLGKDEDEEND